MDDGLLKSTAGYTNFDDLLKNYVCRQQSHTLSPKMKQQLQLIDLIVDKYLNTREQLIFRLATETDKTITDIQNVMGYHTFQTTERHIERVFKLIRCYYRYESLDKDELNKELKTHFNRFERKVIKLLQQRYTVFEMKDMLPNMHYRKMNMTKNDIIKRLNKAGGLSKKYGRFLVEIRRFRRLSDF